jgi:hypothetical protein
MPRLVLAAVSGATLALLVAVICDVLLVDIPARQHGEVHDPPIGIIAAVTVAGAVCGGLCAYKWGDIRFSQAVRYIAVGALGGVLCAAIAGLAISSAIPLWRAGEFKVLWLKTAVPGGTIIGVLVAWGYYLLTQRSREK